MDSRSTWRRCGYAVIFVVVAGTAAISSFSHIRDVALYGHQNSLVAHLLPLSIDGMMALATMAISEDKAQNRYPRAWARFGFWFGAGVSLAANVAATVVRYGWEPASIGVAAAAPIMLLISVEIVARAGKPKQVTEVKPERVYSERHVRRLKAQARAAGAIK
jgi:hypothetical protein